MNDKLYGSNSRDWFRWWHKQRSEGWLTSDYAADGDLFLTYKAGSDAGVAGLYDYKNEGERQPTFAEIIAYNDQLRRGLRVFIITGHPALIVPPGIIPEVYIKSNPQIWPCRFDVNEYLGGDWRPHPEIIYPMRNIGTMWSKEELQAWERRLRGRK